MKSQVIEGSPRQIAEQVTRINARVIQAILLLEEPGDIQPASSGEDIFAEMEPFTVGVGGADYSRESIYAPQQDDE
jgi:hypothetical protein